MMAPQFENQTIMKAFIITAGIFGVLGPAAIAGGVAPETASTSVSTPADGFASARRPMTNPTLFDLALPTTNVHPLFIYHALPDTISTTAGDLPLGGDVEVYALQFEIALNDRLSIVASKDGYVDMNPNSTLGHENGFANLGAGLKYAFILNPAAGTAVSGTLAFELPTGNTDVFQGEGDGLANLMVSGLKLADQWQFAGGTGLQIPFSDEQSTNLWASAHASYEWCRWFIPLVEVNWFHVLDSGDGTATAVSPILEFEGGDFFNLGASNATENRDLVTAAVGFRSRLTDSIDAGVSYEIPLTDDENSLMEKRVTVDLVWKF
jgi:Putative MetA-pathway of phenol degradation